QGVPTAIDQERVQRCPMSPPPEIRGRCAPAAPDRFLPLGCAAAPATQRRLQPDVKIFGGELSWCVPSSHKTIPIIVPQKAAFFSLFGQKQHFFFPPPVFFFGVGGGY